MTKTMQYTQYFCSNASNPNAIKSTTVLSRVMLANNLRVARKSGRWHINKHDDGGYVMSTKTSGTGAKWVLTIEPLHPAK
jgi:hypothetical protein